MIPVSIRDTKPSLLITVNPVMCKAVFITQIQSALIKWTDFQSDNKLPQKF